MFSNQSRMISNAMKKADKALKQSSFGYAPPSGEATVGTISTSTSEGDPTTIGAGDSTIRTNADMSTLPEKVPVSRYILPTSLPPPATIVTKNRPSNLDLKNNDNQFIVFANLIIARFEDVLKTGENKIQVSSEDKDQLSRMVSPEKFVEALNFRLQSVRENSYEQIHVVLRHCRTLGLNRTGDQNPLYAPAGTTVFLEKFWKENTVDTKDIQEKIEPTEFQDLSDPNSLVRQQIMAELREASNLMAESVAPETAQFWRNHVVSLQTRLRELSNKPKTPKVTTESRGEELCLSPVDEDDSPRNRDEAPVQLNPARFGGKHDSLLHRAHDPETGVIPMVDVVAPANLPEGYTFEAEINGRRFLATVPTGGVRKGRTFKCYMKNTTEDQEMTIPAGIWRDGLFDCLKYGVFHPSVVMSFVFPPIGLAQVMTRMGLDHMGNRAPEIPATGIDSTFGMIMTIISCWVLLNIFIGSGLHYKMVEGIALSGADLAAVYLVDLGMFLYTAVAAFNTRYEIRRRYEIPQGRFSDVKDIVYSSLLLPFSIAQMARHTIKYDEVEGRYCTTTGLPAGVEADFFARTQEGSYRLY